MDVATLLSAISFAAEKHKDQRRKDAEGSPYINHPIAVASFLANEGAVTDGNLILAAILHDTVEDTNTTFDELETHFGQDVSDLVREVTDDKRLEKSERKRLQVQHAAGSSPRAKQLKIADKTCNIRDITDCPPRDWPSARRREYLNWSEQVVDRCRGVNPKLEAAFDAAMQRARRTLEMAK